METPDEIAEAVKAGEPADGGKLGALLGAGAGAKDSLTILSGTAQNIAGLGIFVIASFGMNILVAHALGGKKSAAFGQVTLITQLAFVMGAATRFGMDMASVRRVAIEFGKGQPGRSRAIVRIGATIAFGVSLAVGLIVFLAAGPIASFLNAPTGALRAAALALVFVAIAQVYLGGSRGLKIMRHTLYAYWVGQSLSWIVITLVLWQVLEKTVEVTVLAYALSWVFATVVAFVSWRHATRTLTPMPAKPGETRSLLRYGAPRAPAALLSQAIFYTDLAVLSHYLDKNDPRVSIYAAAIRVAQALVLFLTAVSYMFSPFVADLHEKGERDRLNALFKQITRWTLGGTVPLLLLFLIAPAPVLHVFGGAYGSGSAWLRVLLIGQIVNVSVGAAGFVLIMAGRTGWDLAVYASAFLIDLVVATVLIGFVHMGPVGAAVAQSIALVFSNSVRLWLVWRFVHIQPYDRYYAKLLIPTAIGAVVMMGIHTALSGPKWGIDLLGTSFVGGAVYYVALVIFGLTPPEKAMVVRVLGKVTGRVAGARS